MGRLVVVAAAAAVAAAPVRRGTPDDLSGHLWRHRESLDRELGQAAVLEGLLAVENQRNFICDALLLEDSKLGLCILFNDSVELRVQPRQLLVVASHERADALDLVR